MTTNDTQTRQPRLHDLRSLKERIKDLAKDTRDQRTEARKLTGLDRHYAKEEAKENAHESRYLGLAYGYLRGRTIEQMESLYTRPENMPDAGDILCYAHDYFGRGPDAPEWEEITTTEVPVPDDRTFVGKLMGRPAPKPKVRREHNDAPGWDEFATMVEADIKAWKAKVTVARATRYTKPKAEQEVA